MNQANDQQLQVTRAAAAAAAAQVLDSHSPLQGHTYIGQQL
jgi:hypothetical protein